MARSWTPGGSNRNGLSLAGYVKERMGIVETPGTGSFFFALRDAAGHGRRKGTAENMRDAGLFCR